jgi:hypothetical protein
MSTEHKKGDYDAHDMVEATVILRPLDNSNPSVNSTNAVESVLQEAQKQTGLNPEKYVVFEHLNAFSVRAPAQFVEAVGRASEVDSLMANDTEGLKLIAPVFQQPVDLGSATTFTGRSGAPRPDDEEAS